MKPTNIYTFDLAANGPYRLLVAGEYFKILGATGPVDVQSDFGRLNSLVTGQGLAKNPFSSLYFTDVSGAPNTLRVLIGDSDFIDGVTGDVNVQNFPAVQAVNVQSMPASHANQGAFTNTQETVTSASTQMLAANAARRYLLIQNNDATGIIYVTLDGTAATTAKGVKLDPGTSMELQGYVPSGAIFAIGSIGSNANCVAVEG